MNTKRVVILMIGILLVGATIFVVARRSSEMPSGHTVSDSIKTASDYYTCPMHPSVHSDHPGACPICGMTLVKKSSEPDTSMHMSMDMGSVTVSPARQVLADVATTPARRGTLDREIRAVGTIMAAEPNVRRITARFPGRLDHLYLTYTGQSVKKGDPVADVYSPEAISAQEEYLLALGSDTQDGGSLLGKSREKLLRWGFTDAQISALARSGKVRDVVTIYSPISGIVVDKQIDPQQYAAAGQDLYEVADLSSVWLTADLYEYEISDLKLGETVEASTEAYPGKIFRGKITFISPTVDPATRTVRVRAEIPNPTGELKTEMYVNVLVRIRMPETVVVPASAIISTGTHRMVWVQKEEGVFEPRHVVVGATGGDSVQILEGLDAGEIVATSGGYLLDSESQLQAPSSGMGQMEGMQH